VLYVGLGIVIAATVWNDRLNSSARFRNRLLLYLERRALGVGRWHQQQRRSISPRKRAVIA
jgi:hypothetical protein